MTEPHEAQRDELRRVVVALEVLTGLRSRWTGNLVIVSGARFRGAKPFDCDIVISADLIGQDLRWRTLIHERLHALSVGYNPSDYRTYKRTYKGWEEGVVETLQRVLRQAVLDRVGVSVPETVFAPTDALHPYQRYVEAIEALRDAAGTDPIGFGVGLLSTPIRERPDHARRLALTLDAERRRRYLEVCGQARATLEQDENIAWYTKSSNGS